MPPESCRGSGLGEAVQAGQGRAPRAPAPRAAARGTPASSSGSATLPRTSRQGSRRGSWKTSPTRGSGPVTGEPNEQDGAAIGRQEAADDPQQRRLAAAVGAHDGDQLALGHAQVEPIERPEACALDLEAASDPAKLDGVQSVRPPATPAGTGRGTATRPTSARRPVARRATMCRHDRRRSHLSFFHPDCHRRLPARDPPALAKRWVVGWPPSIRLLRPTTGRGLHPTPKARRAMDDWPRL